MYTNSENHQATISNDILIAFIKASDAYLAEPTLENWIAFEKLSDYLVSTGSTPHTLQEETKS